MTGPLTPSVKEHLARGGCGGDVCRFCKGTMIYEGDICPACNRGMRA